jgi:hypothetical protein
VWWLRIGFGRRSRGVGRRWGVPYRRGQWERRKGSYSDGINTPRAGDRLGDYVLFLDAGGEQFGFRAANKRLNDLVLRTVRTWSWWGSGGE